LRSSTLTNHFVNSASPALAERDNHGRRGDRQGLEMTKYATALLLFLATMSAPVVLSPAAHADVCANVGGRHVTAGGCTNIARDATVGAAVAGATTNPEDAAAQAAAGRPPCYTAAGAPYYTPGDLPCN
jgi:hypothetical protein